MKKEKSAPPVISKECPPAAAAIWDCHILEYGDVVDGWCIDRYLAKGGFGTVYRAVYCRDSSRMAAIKIFTGDLVNNDAHGKERIILEAEILKKLNGKGAPVLFSSGDYKGRPYLVREYLQAIEPDEGDLPTEQGAIKTFLKDTIEALKELHKIGWIHCDVKPANIARRLDSGKYVLIDFGSAHEIERDDDHQPRENTMNVRDGEYVRIETRGYAPPELCFQPCRDIYAIGHVIRDCFGRDVPLEWSLIINRCIANAKENRYPDIDSLERDVRNVDRLGREEMRRCIYEDRLKFMRMQEEMAREKAVAFKWDELKERMQNAQSAPDAIYAGAGEMFLDFAALSPCRSIRVIGPVALREDRFVVIKGPGIIRMNMEAFLADEEGDVVGPGRNGNPAMVFLWDNVTLVNMTKKKIEEANVFYVVGDSCYLNFPNVSKKEIFNWKYAVTSNFGFSYAGYDGPKDMASLIRSMNNRLERNIPERGMMISAREFFSDGSDMTIRDYVAKNEIIREVLGMPKA